MSLPKLDTVPQKYQYRSMTGEHTNYWKNDWQGPVEFTEFDWDLSSIGVSLNKGIIPILAK